MIERESVKSVGAYLESQAEAMRQALAALIEIPSYRTQAEEGAPYGKGRQPLCRKACGWHRSRGFARA